MAIEVWDLWYPNAAAQGLLFCRARIEHANNLFVHAAPDALRIEVRADDGALLAAADQLERHGTALPMTRLQRTGAEITREEAWPQAADFGATVLLPGGEAGVLTSWWNADDGAEWRWSVEFYNRNSR